MDRTSSDFDKIKNVIENGQNIILHGPGGVGKCLSPETKILLYNGSIKEASELTLEDVLMGDDSTPRIISSIYSGTDDMYKILSSNGDYFVCNSKHILSLYNPIEKNIVDIDLQDYMKKDEKWKDNHFLFQRAVNFQEKNIKIDPYLLGKKIGSGETHIEFDGFVINLNLGIPRVYITTGAQYRTSLLKGIIDSNGFYHRDHISISSNCDALLQSIKFLSTSLGYQSQIISCNLLEISRTYHEIIYDRFSIISLCKNEYVGFTIDSNARFLLGNLIVTHNSYLIKNIALEFMNKVACTATTGIAAINLSQPGLAGSTLHSWAGVGLADQPLKKIVAKIQHDDRSKKRWLQTTILIIDEISMLGALFFDKLDYIGKEIRRNSRPFGGLQLILCGDFLQLPPVNDKWAFESYVWSELKLVPFILETPKRYKDVNWFATLLRFRKGTHNDQDIELLRNRAQAYAKYITSSSNKLDEVKPTILYAKKVDVAYQNDMELQKLSGAQQEYISIDTFQSYSARARLDFYMTPLEETIPKAIYLKQGAQVMLKYNLDLENGLANGSRGVVTRIFQENVEVKWLNDNITLVSRVTWVQEDKDGKATRTQIPLILAWSITCHKCVSGNTLISTDQGLVYIKQIIKKDGWNTFKLKVATRNGWEYTSNTFKGENETSIKITTRLGYQLEGSVRHPVLVRTVEGKEIWKKLPEIEEGDCLVLKFGFCSPNISYIHTNSYYTDPPFEIVDENFAYFIGLIVGDGSYRDKRDGTVDFSNYDEDLLNLFSNIAEEYLKVRVCSYLRNGKIVRKYFCRRETRKFLLKSGLDYLKGPQKKVPWIIRRSPMSVQKSFIKGLLDTDGGVNKQCIHYTSTSETLINEVHIMLLSFGIISSKKLLRPKTEKWSAAWRICIYGEDSRICYNDIGFNKEAKQNDWNRFHTNKRLSEIIKSNTGFFPDSSRIALAIQKNFYLTKKTGTQLISRTARGMTNLHFRHIPYLNEKIDLEQHYIGRELIRIMNNNFFFDTVAKIEYSECIMYDFEIPGSHSFVSNGIISHNSQGSTLDFAVCDLGPSIFCDGQAYVSISRVRSSEGLFLSDFYPPSIKVNQKALEYVKSIEKPKPLLRLNFRGTPEHLVDCFICDIELMECYAIKKGRNFFCLECSRKI